MGFALKRKACFTSVSISTVATWLVANAQETSTILAAATKNANLHNAALSTSLILRKGLSFGKKQALLQSAEELRLMSRSIFVYLSVDKCLHKRMSLSRRPKVERVIDLALVHTAQTAVALNGVIVLDESEGHRSDIVGFVTGRNVPG